MSEGLVAVVESIVQLVRETVELTHASGSRCSPQPSVTFINFSKCFFQTAALVWVP